MSWESKNIEDCIDKVTYTGKIKRKHFQESGDFPIVSQEQDFINGYWSNEKEVFKVNTPVVIFGDHTKVLKFVDFDFVLGADGVKILQPKNFIYPKYFYYYLQAYPVKSLGYARHYRILKELDINYPQSIKEQKRIVVILDEAFAGIDQAIANTEKNLASTYEFFESYFSSILKGKSQIPEKDSNELIATLKKSKLELINSGLILNKKDKHNYPIKKFPFDVSKNWNWVYLSDISKIQEGPGIRKHQYKEEGVQFLTVTNILEGRVDLKKSEKFISEEEFSKYEHFKINKGDIVTACSGGSWGKSAICNEDNKIILNTSTLRLRFYDDLGNNKYLYYLTKMSFFKNSLRSHTTGQQANFGYSHYSQIPIPLPSLEEQNIIVSNLDAVACKIEKLEKVYQEKLDALNELKQSLLQKAFSGDLTADMAEEIKSEAAA